MKNSILWSVLVPTLALIGACTPGGGTSSGDSNNTGGSSSVGMGGNGQTTDDTSSTGFENGVGGSTSSGTTCNAGPDEDQDGDGFTITQGDCNDCDANVNPNAVEVITDPNGAGGGEPAAPADENCDGQIDEAPAPCDAALAIDSNDANDAARAVGLCKFAASPTDWGVVSSTWVSVDGSAAPSTPNYALGHGMLSAFGSTISPREGGRILGLSSGSARQPTDPGYKPVSGFDKGYTSGSPAGFPKESPSCPGITTGTPHDGAAVQVEVRVPSNAHGFSFDFDFYTYEWPGYVCSKYNDFFVAILDPVPLGQTDGNISFDQLGNPVSVNNAFVQVCGCSNGPPCNAGGKSFTCALGNGELAGTGFESHAATSWLNTTAPVDPGSTIKIRWGVYDSGDGVLDSTTLVDNWKWIAEPGTSVGTNPVPQ